MVRFRAPVAPRSHAPQTVRSNSAQPERTSAAAVPALADTARAARASVANVANVRPQRMLPGGGPRWMLSALPPESRGARTVRRLRTLGLPRHHVWSIGATVPLRVLPGKTATPCSPSSS